MEDKKLFHKDFTLVVIGQIISLFGNSILRFALPLYLLRQTGSSSLFGVVTACSFIPMIFMSPFGGIIADRINKKNIMVVLDFFTALLVLCFVLLFKLAPLVPLLVVVLMILYGIQGTYQPAVQASIPLLVKEEKVVQANAVINMVSSLASFIGPTIGGVLFGLYGLRPILIVSICCFIFSAIMEIFIHIPHEKQRSEDSIFSLVHKDMSISFKLILKDKPILGKVILLISCFNLFLSSMLVIGLPVLITQNLALSDGLYGIAQGVSAVGAIIGGIIMGILGEKVNIKNSYLLLLGCGIITLPMGIVLMFSMPKMISYIVIVFMGFLMMLLATMFSIQILSFVQIQTPPQLLGKVISCLLGISICAMPLGQAIYGFLFERFSEMPWVILFGATISSCIIAILSKTSFMKLNE